MSTHATLGVKFSDGTISGCYVHFDGHTMTNRITDYLKKNTTTGLTVLITEAQSRGGIRSFHCPPYNNENGSPETELLDDDESYIIDESNWEDDHMGTYCKYLIDYETGTVWTESGNAAN